MTEKIRQFQTTLTCECPGHPAIQNKSGRIKCKRKADIVLTIGGNFNNQRREIAKELQKRGWRKLKTLGFFQSMCPQCSKVIEQKRIDNKQRWGSL